MHPRHEIITNLSASGHDELSRKILLYDARQWGKRAGKWNGEKYERKISYNVYVIIVCVVPGSDESS